MAVRGFLLATAIGATILSGAGGAQAEIISASRMLQGVSMTQTQCKLNYNAVWVTASGRSFCIRYYVSIAGGQGLFPVIHLSGDKLGRIQRDGSFDPSSAEDVDTDRLQKIADELSKKTGGPAIYVARIGIDGSSGSHLVRRSWLELYVINAALDAIKEKHGLTGYHLVGQSGGAGLIGGLLGLRNDIGCAVPGSGRLALLKRQQPKEDEDLEHFDALEAIPHIVQKSKARILVVTDPHDQQVRSEHQTTFVQRLRQAGGRADQFFITATDEKHHGATAYAHYAVAACIRGATSQEIQAGLAELVSKRVQAAQSRGASPREAERRPSAQPRYPQDRATLGGRYYR